MTSPDSQLIQTIRGRRTIQEFNGVPIARNTLLGLLNNAVWAPFHSKKSLGASSCSPGPAGRNLPTPF